MLYRAIFALLLAFAPSLALAQSYGSPTFTTVKIGGASGQTITGVGTTPGTVAAGNDTRITGALQAANNLGDLASFSAARATLGLGNAALLNVGTSAGTVAAGDDPRLSTATAFAGQITGYLPTSIPSGSTVTISAGSATDSTNVTLAVGGPFSWAASNGNAANGYQGGTSLPASSTIHFFTMKGSAGVASFSSTSLTPTLPSGYTYYRRIFSLRTDGSGNLTGGVPVEVGGGAITFWLATPTLDINGAAAASANRTLYTLNVPTGVRVQPLYRAEVNGTPAAVNFSSGDEPDVALPQGANAPWTAAPGLDVNLNTSGLNVTGSSAQVGMLTTNTSGQIGARSFSGQAGALYWVTRGFIDFRRN